MASIQHSIHMRIEIQDGAILIKIVVSCSEPLCDLTTKVLTVEAMSANNSPYH